MHRNRPRSASAKPTSLLPNRNSSEIGWLVFRRRNKIRRAYENNLFASEDLGVVEFMSLKPPGESVTMKVTRSLPGSRAATASIAVDDDFHITVEGKYRGDVETNYLIDTNKANQLLDAIAGAAKSSKRTRITFDGYSFHSAAVRVRGSVGRSSRPALESNEFKIGHRRTDPPPVRTVRYIRWIAQADRSRAAPIAARDARLADNDQPRPFISRSPLENPSTRRISDIPSSPDQAPV